MSNDVFANGREISCKKADGKTICCFPDVCFTPPDKVPPTPPGVPIPYPNTAMASDTSGGSKKVKISGKEIMLKNQSYFKKSMGDEAGVAQKKGIVTSKTRGKAYFVAWSMNVKFEGKNVVRHMDMTTHNHGSTTNTGPWVHFDKVYVPVQQDAKVEGKHKCECCGGDAHCQAQAEGNHLTEEQFYDSGNNAENAAVLARVRSNPKCKHLLPREGKQASGCNKYYVTTPQEKGHIETDWSLNSSEYREFQGVAPNSDIAHRVPKAAGGCPAGQGNLAPVGPKCEKLEAALSDLQCNRINQLRAG